MIVKDILYYFGWRLILTLSPSFFYNKTQNSVSSFLLSSFSPIFTVFKKSKLCKNDTISY